MSGRTAERATPLTELHRRVMEVTTAVVNTVGSGRLALPTPCAAWNLGQLLAHMTGQNHGFAAVARGEKEDASVFADRPVGDDPAGVFAASAHEVTAAFAEEGVLEREFWLPEIRKGGGFPARLGIGFHFIDYVVHGWDVAVSIGAGIRFDDEVLTTALPIAEAVPDGSPRTLAGAAFAPGLATAPDAVPLDRILTLLGRDPLWAAPQL
ncbi:TIGR03086 family metal-binding protein [Streptomyces sp. NPDC002926]